MMENLKVWPSRAAKSGPVVLALGLFGLFLAATVIAQVNRSSNTIAVLPVSSTALQIELTELRKETQYQQAQIRSLRAMLGSLSCKVQQVGPTGGFCLSVAKPGDTPGLNTVDAAYAKLLGELFTGQSVLDGVGTGLGNYGKWFKENAPSVKWEGTDGAENVEEVTGGWVKFADFTEELRWAKRDWVMSIEVGEHVAQQHEGVFVDNLCGLAKTGVVISWARPGQGGYAHVNEKSFDDVKQMFLDGGMTSDESLGLKLREAASVSWLATNTQVFRWPKQT